MNVINRIQFPHTLETTNLYINCHNGASLSSNKDDVKVTFKKGGFLSFNTYFNSFYEKFYAKYTELEFLYYLLKLEGDFQISLYRERHGQTHRELIYQETVENCQLEKQTKICLPDSWRSENMGRVYLERMCLSEHGSFVEGCLATEQNPLREVSLGIITCTFKKEAYVKKTVENILKDGSLKSKNLKVFVVDNAKTLNKEEFPNQSFELISNRNVGGSGGFTRGLVQALEEDVYTHFLFMDDDIELEPESIYRLFPLYEYAKQDFALAGSMLDLHKKNLLHEAGGLYSKTPDNNNYKYDPFEVACINPWLNLENPQEINHLLSDTSPDYAGFWFCAFSKETVQKMGLPIPFFIKLDDIEFGLRMKERLGHSIVYLPGIAVWHEPFYAKNPVWDTYYWVRNHLITHSMRQSLKYTDAVKFLTKRLLHKLFIFDYNSAEMIIRGFEDYMQGPLLMENDPETLHAKIIGLSKTYKSQSVKSSSSLGEQTFNDTGREMMQLPTFRRLFALATLNGHLLPNFLLSNDAALFIISAEHIDWWPKVFTKKRVLFFRDSNISVYQHEMSRTAGIGILMRWLLLIIQSSINWSSVSTEWKNHFSRLTSLDFWKEYLKLNESHRI